MHRLAAFSHTIRTVTLVAALAGTLSCSSDLLEEIHAVQEVVERAAAAREAEDFDAFVACYSGDKAGRYREELKTRYGDNPAAFFASKRRMAAVGPVDIKRRAFATVRIILIHESGYKPFLQAALVYRDDRWLLDSFLPGDRERPRTHRADPEGVLQILHAAVLDPVTPTVDDNFRRIQVIRAMEVIAARGLVDAVPALADLMQGDADAGVRQFAAAVLGSLGSASAAPALQDALRDPDLRVRGDAAAALGVLGLAEARSALQELQGSDESDWVRQQAREALRKLQP